MVSYVLGKLLQKYKLDKLSQVIFHTVELTELFGRTVFIWTGLIVRRLYTFFNLSGAEINVHQQIFAWLFGIAVSFWMVSSGSVSLADHEDVPYHFTAFCPVIWASKSSALYPVLGKNPRNFRPNSSLIWSVNTKECVPLLDCLNHWKNIYFIYLFILSQLD